MEQVIIGGYDDVLNVGTTEYNMLCGGASWNSEPDNIAQCISTAGKIKNLRVELDGVPGTGTYTFTLYRRVGTGAWGDTTLTCTIAADGTSASDTEHEVTVAAGDVVCLKCVPSSPDNARLARWTMMFEGDTAKESLLLTSSEALQGATVYTLAMGGHGYAFTENDRRAVCPTGGKIKNLYVQLKADPGTSPDAYRFILRVNGANSDDGEGNPLQCTITANDKTGNDTTHEITVSAGDILTVMCEPLNVPDVGTFANIGMTFVADTDGESLILGGTRNDLSDSLTEYTKLVSYSAWTTTETDRYQLAQACTFKKLYVLLNGSPGTDNNYTFTVRQNGTSPASGLVVTIADAATTGNDTAHTITIADGDEVDLMVVPTSTPTVRDAHWGLVCFIVGVVAPTVTTQAVSSIGTTTATGNGNITATGGVNCSKRGVCYNTTGSPDVNDSTSEETDSFGTGAFTRAMTSLDYPVKYYVKAYAYNSAGYGYGSEVKFITHADASCVIGIVASASRKAAVTRNGSTSIGLVASASKVKGATRFASCVIGIVASATRKVDITRAGSTTIGLVASASRKVSCTRLASCIVGIVATGARTLARIRRATTQIGIVAIASRKIDRTRAGSVVVGLLASASRKVSAIRSGTTTIGIVATASRALTITRKAATQIGLTATATRKAAVTRVASVVIGITATASFFVAWIHLHLKPRIFALTLKARDFAFHLKERS